MELPHILLNRHIRELVLYGLIGLFSSSLDFGVFTLLAWVLGINYLVANCISVLVGISTSFTLNRKYNFKVEDRMRQRFLIFLSVGLCGLFASNVILYLCIGYLGLSELMSKLISIVIVVGFQFLLNKFITFRVSTNQ